MDSPDPITSALLDEAVAEALIPFPCPSCFGPGGRYRLEELIVAGRGSLVYRATDLRLSSEGFDAAVVIKIGRSGPRLRTDALSARRVAHPNVLAILDQGLAPEGVEYLVAEYVDGGDLSQRPGPWDPKAAAAVIAKIARGVQAAHAAGVVHCDLKPANILITKTGEPKVADFDLSHREKETNTTTRGNVAFMSPEQLAGEPWALTPPSDTFALGGILYHLLTGDYPHGDTYEEVLATHASRTSAPSPGVERDLDLICKRAMAPRRENRYHSAGELADDLEAWLSHEPIRWTRPSAPRLARLWATRHPGRAVMAGTTAAALLAVGVVWPIVMWREAAREAESQARAAAMAADQIETIKSRVREHIRTFVQMTFSGDTATLQDRMLPTLVFLEWIVDSPVLSDDVRLSMNANRIFALRGLVETYAAQGDTPRLDALLAKYSLAYFLLDEGDGLEAADLLRQIRANWSEKLDARDPIWAAIEAMEECARINAESSSGMPIAEASARLQRAESRLTEADGSGAVRRLLRRARLRLEGHGPPS